MAVCDSLQALASQFASEGWPARRSARRSDGGVNVPAPGPRLAYRS
jgi:hypothetical protein